MYINRETVMNKNFNIGNKKTYHQLRIEKGLGSLTNNFCPANFEKIILQRASKCFNYYKI